MKKIQERIKEVELRRGDITTTLSKFEGNGIKSSDIDKLAIFEMLDELAEKINENERIVEMPHHHNSLEELMRAEKTI